MDATGADQDRTLTWRHARRTVAAVIGLLAILVLAVVVRNALVYRAIRRINERGGWVMAYSDPFPLWEHWPQGVRSWLRDVWVVRAGYDVLFDADFGPDADFFGFPFGMTLSMPPSHAADPGDEGLAAARDLGRVRWLSLNRTSVSDAGLATIADLPMLENLHLRGTRVAGPGLAHLRGLPLDELSLAGTPLDDAGLAYLDDLPELERLDLSGTRVKGPGLVYLARFPSLRTLDLGHTSVDDRALGAIAALPVTHLLLDATAVSDAGLDDLARIPRLDSISLCGTRVTYDAARRSPVAAIRLWGETGPEICKDASPP